MTRAQATSLSDLRVARAETRRNDACPVCAATAIRERPERLRDTDEIRVRQCDDCTHVFLDSFDHIGNAYFERGEFMMDKPFINSVDDRLRHYAGETAERASRIGPLVVNKRVLDFGCGTGALMEHLAPLAKSIEGLEPTQPFRERLQSRSLRVYSSIEELRGQYDVVLMFHVLEHLPDPIASLRALSNHLAFDGLIYIEVPNVNDALISLYEIDACRRFLFFKDHLQYFTRTSLAKSVRLANLSLSEITGHNRFGLANHLYWLARGKPNGHKVWSFLDDDALSNQYKRLLAAADVSDSLIAQVTLTPR